MTILTQDMRTHCVGRLLIDLPQHTTWKSRSSGARIGNLNLSVTTGVSREQFDQMVKKRWLEVQAIKADSSGTPYMKQSERIDHSEHGLILAYAFEQIHVPDINGVWKDQVFHNAEGYFWDRGTLFEIKQKLNGKDDIAKLFPRLRARAPDEIPSQPGLCLNGAFISGFYDMQERENLIWPFQLPRNMGLVVKHNRVGRPQPSLLERELESRGAATAWLNAMLKPGDVYEEHLFRRAQHQIGELIGDELVSGELEGRQEYGYDTSIGGVWEFSGQGAPSPVPQIELNLNARNFDTSYIPSPAGGFPKPEDAPNGPTEAEFFEVWDAVINSVRIRPNALTPPPK